MLESISPTQWWAAYVLVSLVLWLIYEVSGMAAEASKKVFDGHLWATVIIPLWLPALGFGVCLLIVFLSSICLGWLLGKSRTITLNHKNVTPHSTEFVNSLSPANRAKYEAGEDYEF